MNVKSLVKRNYKKQPEIDFPDYKSSIFRAPKNKKISGISMLIEQAKPCFKMWFGKNPSVDEKMLNAIYKKI